VEAIASLIARPLDGPVTGPVPKLHYTLNVFRQLVFARLQRHAKPLVDTIDTVVNRALDALEQTAAPPTPESGYGIPAEQRIDPRALPSLTHTKVLEASVDGEPIARANWNLLLNETLRCVMKRVGSFEKLKQVCPVNMVKGRKEEEGYSYLADIEVSVQGQDANSACRTVVTAAQTLGMAIDVGFMWRHKEAAAYPGERARLQIAAAAAAKPSSALRRSA
jgi:hypothetical protein